LQGVCCQQKCNGEKNREVKTFSKCTRSTLEMSGENCDGNTSTSTSTGDGKVRMGTVRIHWENDNNLFRSEKK